jgi:quinol monooxygenase YgiN
MSEIYLINPVEAADENEIQFLDQWAAQARLARQADGMNGMKLLRSIDPHARFRFVILEEWSDLKSLARSGYPAEGVPARHIYPCSHYPGLYKVFSR